MKSTGAHSSNEWQWIDLKIGKQDSTPNNDHQSDMPHYHMGLESGLD